MRFLLQILITCALTTQAWGQLPAIGMWREHAPYQGTIDVTASDNKIYAATEYNLFSIDRHTKEIQRISKISGSTETGIAAINFNELTKQLLVSYTNSNIDVIDEHGVHNIPAMPCVPTSRSFKRPRLYSSTIIAGPFSLSV